MTVSCPWGFYAPKVLKKKPEMTLSFFSRFIVPKDTLPVKVKLGIKLLDGDFYQYYQGQKANFFRLCKSENSLAG